jgi:hypothetical protein
MKRSYFIIVLAIVFSLSLFGAQSWAGERIYQMVGDITAIDLEYNTVVIKVPLAGTTFTVGDHFLQRLFWKELANRWHWRISRKMTGLRSNGRLPDKATLLYHLGPSRKLVPKRSILV